jgi:stearoyl-CoA desaturase (delta-9 desaturase)
MGLDAYIGTPQALPFWLVHLGAVIGVALVGWSWSGLALAIGLYYLRMFFVTGAYHRYFSHKSYKTSRGFQLFLAFMAQTSSQKGVLWWAAHHRWHHRFSDQPEDVHSYSRDGFWWSHVGWILAARYEDTDESRVSDLARYPELRWLNRYWYLPVVVYGVTCFLVGGWSGLVWGYLVSTVLLWHGTFTINSLSHRFGNRRYATTDDSKNNWLLALITMGEGWHNNHHYRQTSARNGFFWWEIDMTYYGLRLLALLGLVWDLRQPSARALDAGHQPAPAARPTRELPTTS